MDSPEVGEDWVMTDHTGIHSTDRARADTKGSPPFHLSCCLVRSTSAKRLPRKLATGQETSQRHELIVIPLFRVKEIHLRKWLGFKTT